MNSSSPPPSRSPLVVANASGFYGDRFSAVREVVQGGPIHVLTGDYLAELTLAILHRTRRKDPGKGYATTFLAQLEEVLGTCLDRGIRVVSNAGGLAPRALATAIEAMAARLGLSPRVAVVEGDDLAPCLDALQAAGETFPHFDRGEPLGSAKARVLTANAYLGGWGIREALARGADVVVTGRVTDAALVLGPAAHHFDWARDDWDALAGALVAGHVLECGTQATGGNYTFFEEVPSFDDIGFPLAEIAADGSFVVTKHPGTGGLVSTGTVVSQLLYEISGARYASPDVVARFDGLLVTDEGEGRVRVQGARGEPPPDTSKVAIILDDGFENDMTVVLTGRDIEKKRALLLAQLERALGGREGLSRFDVAMSPPPPEDPPSNEAALAKLTVRVASDDEGRVGKRFARAVVELALASVPGFTLDSLPEAARPRLLYFPTTVSARHVAARVLVAGEVIEVPAMFEYAPFRSASLVAAAGGAAPGGDVVRVALGRVFGTRSGDKGGNATLGVFARSNEAYAFLRDYLDADRLAALLPDVAWYPIERFELPGLRAVGFVIRGLLGDGVSSSIRFDPQAKTLGEYLGARVIEVPRVLLGR